MQVKLPLALLGATALLLPLSALAQSAPAEDLVDAMDVPSAKVITSSIDTPQPSQPGMFDVLSSLGGFTPQDGGTLALLFTGDVAQITSAIDHDWPEPGEEGDHAILTFDIEVPSWANSFKFAFNFLSQEYPEWLGSQFTDTFEAHAESEGYSGPIALDPAGDSVSMASTFSWVTDPALLANSGFDDDGASLKFQNFI